HPAVGGVADGELHRDEQPALPVVLAEGREGVRRGVDGVAGRVARPGRGQGGGEQAGGRGAEVRRAHGPLPGTNPHGNGQTARPSSPRSPRGRRGGKLRFPSACRTDAKRSFAAVRPETEFRDEEGCARGRAKGPETEFWDEEEG